MTGDFNNWNGRSQVVERRVDTHGKICNSQCVACRFVPCPECMSAASELEQEQARAAAIFLRYMAASIGGGVVLAAVIVTGISGHFPLVIGLVAAVGLSIAGLLWLFGDEFLRFAETASKNRDLRSTVVDVADQPCDCAGTA